MEGKVLMAINGPIKKLLNILILCLMCGCSVIKPPAIKEEIRYVERDSLVLTEKEVLIPKERIVDVVPAYDTLNMETSMAEARAWVDTTTHTLKGELKNKSGTQYKYVDREKIVYKDSIVTKEVPVEVEKIVKTHYPYEKWLWIYTILSLAGLALLAYFKIRP